MLIRSTTCMLLLTLFLAACAPAGQQATATSVPPTPRPPEAEPTAEVAVPAAAEEIVAAARSDLARRLSVDSDAIETLNVEAVEWSDASLGCPAPNEMYAQVITPGFRIRLQVQDEVYEYHTDAESTFVLCQGGQPAESRSQGGTQNPDEYY